MNPFLTCSPLPHPLHRSAIRSPHRQSHCRPIWAIYAVLKPSIEHSLTFLKRPRTQGRIKHCRTHRDKWIAHADAGHVIPEAVDLIPVIKLQNIASWIANVIRIGWFERHYGDDIIHSRMNMLIELKHFWLEY